KLTALLNGKPVIVRAIEPFEQCPEVEEVLVVIKPERQPKFEALVQAAGLKKVRRFVQGGRERYLSVWAALQILREDTDVVAVHDAARPLISQSTVTQAIQRARNCGAVALAAPIVDTLKRADGTPDVVDSIDRVNLWAMQTPQVFRYEWLFNSYQQVVDSGKSVTDEVSAVQQAGYKVRLLPNPDWNIKITFPKDLQLAEKMINDS
ncbi:MAG: 2-C-methyl-D-erythritol 4-phosphate cytidylyltransferase, partial [Verrucomicrobia bacterium]|nr:2-C-methyl-D-erythritol 4-phosphate cytidylyltransferase [Verrucomicrobiota bacterium]